MWVEGQICCNANPVQAADSMGFLADLRKNTRAGKMWVEKQMSKCSNLLQASESMGLMAVRGKGMRAGGT